MIFNGVMALTLRYFTEFGEPAFQLITASRRPRALNLLEKVDFYNT